MFVSNQEQLKYLVEYEGDEALFEGKGQVGPGFITNSYAFGLFWLNDEGFLRLKQRKIRH